jgi:hypothetical protein
MSDVLRGNFTPKKPVNVEIEEPKLEQQFEREALKRLGGSIAFVSRKRLMWNGDSASKNDGGTRK